MMDTAFKALNDATRRAVLELLKKKALTAGEIADKFQVSKPTISHHLDLLKQAKLVTAQKEGQFIYYALNQSPINEIMKWMTQFSNNKKSK